MQIHVTKHLIKIGRPEDPKYCPVAMAISQALNLPVSVDGDSIQVGVVRVPLPRKAKRFIGKFDSGKEVEPIEFNVKLLGKAER